MFEIGTPDQVIGNENIKARVEVNEKEIAVRFIEELDLTLKVKKLLENYRDCDHDWIKKLDWIDAM